MKILSNKYFNELTEQIELLENEKYSKNKIIREKDKKIEHLNSQILNLEKVRQDLVVANTSLNESISTYKSEILKLSEENEKVNEFNKCLLGKIGGLTASRNRQEKKINILKQEINDCYNKIKNYKDHLKSIHVKKTPKDYILKRKSRDCSK